VRRGSRRQQAHTRKRVPTALPRTYGGGLTKKEAEMRHRV
jgi:hypothetical protein